MADITYSVQGGLVFACAHTNRARRWFTLQHSNLRLAEFGGNAPQEFTASTDRFDESLLEENLQEWGEQGLTAEAL